MDIMNEYYKGIIILFYIIKDLIGLYIIISLPYWIAHFYRKSNTIPWSYRLKIEENEWRKKQFEMNKLYDYKPKDLWITRIINIINNKKTNMSRPKNPINQ